MSAGLRLTRAAGRTSVGGQGLPHAPGRGPDFRLSALRSAPSLGPEPGAPLPSSCSPSNGLHSASPGPLPPQQKGPWVWNPTSCIRMPTVTNGGDWDILCHLQTPVGESAEWEERSKVMAAPTWAQTLQQAPWARHS